MSEDIHKYLVKIPEEYSGEVMGKLTVLGVAVESIDTKNGTWAIKAQSRENVFNEFEPWLLDLTNGAGIIEKG